MTEKEFMKTVAMIAKAHKNCEDSTDEDKVILDEVIDFAEKKVEKIEADAEKKRNTKSKARIENEKLANDLFELMDEKTQYLAADIASMLEVSSSKATVVAKILVEDGRATVQEVKGKKGKVKGYTKVAKEGEA